MSAICGKCKRELPDGMWGEHCPYCVPRDGNQTRPDNHSTVPDSVEALRGAWRDWNPDSAASHRAIITAITAVETELRAMTDQRNTARANFAGSERALRETEAELRQAQAEADNFRRWHRDAGIRADTAEKALAEADLEQARIYHGHWLTMRGIAADWRTRHTTLADAAREALAKLEHTGATHGILARDILRRALDGAEPEAGLVVCAHASTCPKADRCNHGEPHERWDHCEPEPCTEQESAVCVPIDGAEPAAQGNAMRDVPQAEVDWTDYIDTADGAYVSMDEADATVAALRRCLPDPPAETCGDAPGDGDV